MGFEFGLAGPQSCFGFPSLAASLAISNWFRWSLRPQPVQTYEVESLFAIRFLLPFPAKCEEWDASRHVRFTVESGSADEASTRAPPIERRPFRLGGARNTLAVSRSPPARFPR